MTGQGGLGQGNTGWIRTGQHWEGQGKGRAGEVRSRAQGGLGQGNTGKAREGQGRPGKARPGQGPPHCYKGRRRGEDAISEEEGRIKGRNQ